LNQDNPAAPQLGRALGWFGIIRLGLVQAALGSIVVLATSTMNRVMVVELALPAVVPGALVAFHYLIQILRPRLGYGSDRGGRRTPWIIGGMILLAIGGVLAAAATALMAHDRLLGIGLAVVAFMMIGIGVGASGTSLLVLLAKQVVPERRAAAASIVWVMMIAGFAITAGTAGHFLQPFSFDRLIRVTACVALVVLAITLVAIWGIEDRPNRSRPVAANPARSLAGSMPKSSFKEALFEVWAEPRARRFAIFVFVSMLGYSAQELVLEPFAGAVLGLTPGDSAQLTGIQHAGALIGMIVVALAGSVLARGRFGSMRTWTVSGCFGSAASLVAVACAGFVGPAWPLQPSVFFLGAANGAFAVSAIGSMMGLAGDGKGDREGLRMGLWGAAQAVAFALGGLVATIASDLSRYLLGSPAAAYAVVFAGEAILFLAAAKLAVGVFATQAAPGKGASAQASRAQSGVGLATGRA
jgi:BCD family chlorophyll transporter-like MFS transporter